MAAPASSSTTAPAPPNPPFTAPFPVHILEDDVLLPPEPHHIALLSDIYLLPCSQPSPCPHSPTWDALTSSTRIRLQIDRLLPTALPADLNDAVAAFEHPSISSGFALRITGSSRSSRASVANTRKRSTRVLVAPTEALRDAWLTALRLQLAPACMIRDEVVAVARGTENGGVIARDARRALAQVTAGAGTSLSLPAPATIDGGQAQTQDESQNQTQGASDNESSGAVQYAERAIELVKRGGASSNFSTTCLQALHDVVSVGNVEALSRCFGGVALVGPVLVVAGFFVKSLLMMSLAEAELPNLVSMRGRIEEIARKLFVIAYVIVVRSSRGDEVHSEEFVEDVIEAFVDCAGLAGDVERHILHKRTWRARNVEDVDGLRTRLAELELSLKFSRHAQFAAGLEARLVQFQSQVGDRFDRVERTQQDHVGLLSTCTDGVEELIASIADIQEKMATAIVGNAYTPVFHRIPKVPQPVVLDGIAQLKPLLSLLRNSGGVYAVSGEPSEQSSSGSSASISSDEDAHSVSPHGWGGVGKTTACIIIARDKSVMETFPGGAVFLEFGAQVMDADVVGQLRDFVSVTGGNSPEGKNVLDAIDKVEPTRTQVSRVVGLVADWVKGRRVLFVADNLFPRAQGVQWAKELVKLAESPGSVLLYSTRLSELAEFAPPERRFVFERVQNPVIARNIFVAHAGLERNEVVRDPVQTTAIDMILSTCTGWHLALKMAGKMVQLLRYDWALVKESMENAALIDINLPDEGGVGLIMSVSLKLLGGLPCGRLKVLGVPLSAREVPVYFERLYMRLALLSKVKSVPLSLLPLVFGVSDAKAVALAWLFNDAGLATIENSVDFESGEGFAAGSEMFSLHDLQLQFAIDLCASSGPDASVAAQHWSFLSDCCTLGSGAKLPLKEHDWSIFCSVGSARSTSRDEYIRNHLFWHLVFASEHRQADVKAAFLFMLSNFAWLRGRICADGFMSVVWDCKVALAAEKTCRFNGEERNTIEALRQVVMEMGGGVSLEFDGTFAVALMQRAGLRSDLGDRMFPDLAFSKRLAQSAESEVRGTWLRPLGGCSRGFGNDSRLLEKLNVGASCALYAVAGLGDGEHVVSAGRDGRFGCLRVHKNEDLDAVLDWDGRSSLIRTIAVARCATDGSLFTIFSGGEDEDGKGCVRFWEIVLDKAGVPRLGDEGLVGECGDVVRSLSVSEDGLRLAAGCRDGLVFIWTRSDVRSSSAFKLIASFPCGTDDRRQTRERSWVNVAVSSCGAWVIAGTWAGDLAFWEDGGVAREGSLVRVASTRPWHTDGRLQAIVFSGDDSSAIVFFSCPAGFEVWDLSTKSVSASRQTLDGLESLSAASVTCLPVERGADGGGAVSRTRFLVAAEYEDGGQNALLEFDLSSMGNCVTSYEIDDVAQSVCYVTMAGARRAVAVCCDGTVLLLDVSGGAERSASGTNTPKVYDLPDMDGAEIAAQSLQNVCAVAVLPQRGTVLAGHDDGTISLWCAKSGNYKGIFKNANGDQVLCLDVSENENLIVSGHAGGSIIVWHMSSYVDHWHPRCVVRAANSKGIISLTISADDSRILSVDEVGDIRFWDAITGGDSAWVVSSALGFPGMKFVTHKKRSCRPAISRDGKFFVWAMRGSLGVWRASLIDLRSGMEVSLMKDVEWNDGFGFYRFVSDCLERDGVDISSGWRFGASFWGRLIELQAETGGEETILKISPGGIIQKDPPVLRIGGSNVRCFLETASLAVLSDATFDFGKTAGSFAAGWMPQDGDTPCQVVIACWIAHSNRPAILHHVLGKL